jgi:hypothetical protein
MTDQTYDPQTGEVVGKGAIQQWYQRPLGSTTPIKTLLGERPPVKNLRDHPEFNGKKVVICNVDFHSGEFGDFVIAGVIPLDENDKPDFPVIIMTGSEDIMGRLMALEATIKAGNAVTGTLRQAGRAWFID